MAKAIAVPALIVRVVNIVMVVALVVFAPNLKQIQLILCDHLVQTQQTAIFMLANVKHSPKRERGVKEVAILMGIAGNMGNNIRVTGNRKGVCGKSG